LGWSFKSYYNNRLKIKEAVRTLIGEEGFDEKLSDRIDIAIRMEEDFVMTTAQVIVIGFHLEKNRELWPSNIGLKRKLGWSRRDYSINRAIINKVVTGLIEVDGFDSDTKSRIELAMTRPNERVYIVEFDEEQIQFTARAIIIGFHLEEDREKWPLKALVLHQTDS